MKLTLELVPDICKLQSLERFLTSKAWNMLRKQTLEECHEQCAICGASAPPSLHCHEQWGYDDETHIQRLVRLIMLCPMCHHTKHMSAHGSVTPEELVQHFIKMNDCSRQEFDTYYQQCSEERTQRTGGQQGEPLRIWKQDYGEYVSLLAQEGNLKRKYRGLNLAIDGF